MENERQEDDEFEFTNASDDADRSSPMEKNGKNGTQNGRGGTAVASANGQAKPLPVHTVRVGGIKATIWRNTTQNGPMFNTTISRTYKTQQGEWAESHSLSRDDLLVAAKALDLAHTFIVEAEATARAQKQDETE